MSTATAQRATSTLAPAATRNMLRRFSWGPTDELFAAAKAAGGARPWFNQQLADTIDDSAADAMRSWFPHLNLSVAELITAGERGLRPWDFTMELVRWTLLRRTFSKRQVHEVMTAFWSDHLHIPTPTNNSWELRLEHDAMIRTHALGRFEDMLVQVDLGRAMGCYLVNALSTKQRLNENLGREVLELHTVGLVAGYGEADVLDSSRILTGYRVDLDTLDATYVPADHYVGPVSVLEFSRSNSSPDGRQVAEDYLRYLARHPATARRIARKLCVRFVSDSPGAAIVDTVAAAYLSSGTDIKKTLRALVGHPDFLASSSRKTRTPVEDAVASYRALGMQATPPTQSTDFAYQTSTQVIAMGECPFEWPRPDGPPDVADAWVSVTRMLGSFNVHYQLANEWNPRTGVTYPDPESWFPPFPATVRQIASNVFRRILFREPDERMLAAVAQRIELPLDQSFASYQEGFRPWRVPRLLAAVLDTPEHMSR